MEGKGIQHEHDESSDVNECFDPQKIVLEIKFGKSFFPPLLQSYRQQIQIRCCSTLQVVCVVVRCGVVWCGCTYLSQDGEGEERSGAGRMETPFGCVIALEDCRCDNKESCPNGAHEGCQIPDTEGIEIPI